MVITDDIQKLTNAHSNGSAVDNLCFK